ncbi:MAG: hypothetical protein U0326_11925 [Polyangiales bacterium]
MQINTNLILRYGLVTFVIALVTWQVWRALVRKSNKQDVSLKRSLDTQAQAVAARWLSQRMSITEATALEGLKTSSDTNSVAIFWREHEAQLHMVFAEVARGNYQVTFRVLASGDDRMEQTHSITLDELPNSIRTAFMRGNSSMEVRWTPTFEQET